MADIAWLPAWREGLEYDWYANVSPLQDSWACTLEGYLRGETDTFYIRKANNHYEFLHAPMGLWTNPWTPLMARTLEDAMHMVDAIIEGK